jgi:hypothetical protein
MKSKRLKKNPKIILCLTHREIQTEKLSSFHTPKEESWEAILIMLETEYQEIKKASRKWMAKCI